MKRSLLIMILSAVLAVLIAGAIVVNAVMAKRAANNTQSGNETLNENLPEAKTEYGEYSLTARDTIEYLGEAFTNIQKCE